MDVAWTTLQTFELGATRTVRKLIRIISKLAFTGAEPAVHRSVSRLCWYTEGAPHWASETKEEQMNTKRFILAGCVTIILSAGTAQAGPCDTAGKAASAKDAGSGPTVGNTGQTTGASKDVSEHPPTRTMNRAAGDVATSSQDAQKQMQGQPTAAQQAQGVEPSAQTADKGC
jgi:hypothetical protein